MQITYDKNECGYKCMVEIREGGKLKRGVSYHRHRTKAQAKADALQNIEPVMF